MNGSNGSNELTKGVPDKVELNPFAKQFVNMSPEEAMATYSGGYGPDPISASMLWGLGKGLYGLIKVPSQVVSGEFPVVPGSRDVNDLMPITEYGTGLALAGMGMGATPELLLGRGFNPALARQFGAWHGTGVNRPFREFSDEFIGSGEGAQVYGWGHYVGGVRKTGEIYRRQVAGSEYWPLNEDGFPMEDQELFNKYYEPGTIVPSHGGTFDRVIDNPPDKYGVRVQKVVPKFSLLDNPESLAALPEEARDILWFTNSGVRAGRDVSAHLIDLMKYPEAWTDSLFEGSRLHSTYPDTRNIMSVADVRGWKLGQPGGLLHINVKPEEHELLDLDETFPSQSPGVQDKLTELYRKLYDVRPEQKLEIQPHMTGSMIQEDIRRLVGPNGTEAAQAMAGNVNRPDRPLIEGTYPEIVSRLLDDNGIPGNKFLDWGSRNRDPRPTLKHRWDFMDAPHSFITDLYLRNKATADLSLDEAITNLTGSMRKHAGEMLEHEVGMGPDGIERTPQDIARYNEDSRSLKDMSDWVDKEHAAGNFSIGDGRTRNYVMFDPKNLEIMTWNGRKLEPVEGDPFDVTRPPSE